MAGGLEAALKQTIKVFLESHERILAFGGNPEDRGVTAAVGGPVHADQGVQGRHGAPGRVWGAWQGDYWCWVVLVWRISPKVRT